MTTAAARWGRRTRPLAEAAAREAAARGVARGGRHEPSGAAAASAAAASSSSERATRTPSGRRPPSRLLSGAQTARCGGRAAAAAAAARSCRCRPPRSRAARALATAGGLARAPGGRGLGRSDDAYRQRLPGCSVDNVVAGGRHDFLGNLVERGRTAVLLSGDTVVGACTWAPHVAAGLAEVCSRHPPLARAQGPRPAAARVEARLLADGVRCAVACAGHDTVPFGGASATRRTARCRPRRGACLDPFGNSALVMKRLATRRRLYLDGVRGNSRLRHYLFETTHNPSTSRGCCGAGIDGRRWSGARAWRLGLGRHDLDVAVAAVAAHGVKAARASPSRQEPRRDVSSAPSRGRPCRRGGAR